MCEESHFIRDYSQVRSCDETLVKEKELTFCYISLSEMWQINRRLIFSDFPGFTLVLVTFVKIFPVLDLLNPCLKFEKQYFCIPRESLIRGI